MELKNIVLVEKFIKANNKLYNFLLVKLSMDVDINTYIHTKIDIIGPYKIRYHKMEMYTVLYSAIKTNNITAIAWVIKNGANVNQMIQITYSNYIYNELKRDYVLVPFKSINVSPLQVAMKNNFLLIAQILIYNGADTSCLIEDDKKKLEVFFNTFSNIDNNNNKPFTSPCP